MSRTDFPSCFTPPKKQDGKSVRARRLAWPKPQQPSAPFITFICKCDLTILWYPCIILVFVGLWHREAGTPGFLWQKGWRFFARKTLLQSKKARSNKTMWQRGVSISLGDWKLGRGESIRMRRWICPLAFHIFVVEWTCWGCGQCSFNNGALDTNQNYCKFISWTFVQSRHTPNCISATF